MEKYVADHIDILDSDLDFTFTKKELLNAIKKLKNNKATSFDSISNEMLKYGIEPLSDSFLLICNTILSFNLYPAEWKKDILGPLHKSGDKSDPNNFRGICVSSCFGKVFNSMLRTRLADKCKNENIIHKSQASGRENVRTSDHLLVLKHIIQKYTKIKKTKTFCLLF